MDKEKLLEVKKISKIFKKNSKEIVAIKDVSFYLNKGECLGILGESGSGKSTLARILVGIEKASTGEITLENNLIRENFYKDKNFRKSVQIIFQNPISSFNPRMKIFDYLYEPLRNYDNLTKKEALVKIKKVLEKVNMDEFCLEKYPNEFSGGQLQRLAIARAIITEPKIIIYDEATSALDASIQNQIINLLEKLQKDLKLSYIFIGHDSAIVQKVSQRIIVMHNGEIVEVLDSENLKDESRHIYTKTLINAVYDVYGER